MSVKYGGHLYPSNPFDDPAAPLKPGACTWCGGTGLRAESINDNRPDELVPCFACQRFCKACGKYRKVGHQCSK